MSLIRTALVLGVIVYVLPTDAQKQRDLVHSASDTLAWGVTYCQREPATCDQAKAAWQQMVEKAKFGAALASDLASTWSARHGDANAAVATVSDRLTIEDALADDPTKAVSLDQVQSDPSING